jgi:DNA processing protein
VTAGYASASLPPSAYAAALSCLPGAGPAWLVEVLATYEPQEAWALAVAGELGPPAPGGRRRQKDRIAAAAGGTDVASLWRRCQDGGITVAWPGQSGFPAALAEGPSPPGVLFSRGHLAALERCAVVAVVGTRRCTPEGAATAFQLGSDLARAGVCVVSGLALGIDGAAHSGAISAAREARDAGEGAGVVPTVGVAASGVDVVYPRQHAALWREVAHSGAVISETPPGTVAQPWRFPSRNRLIAGLARMVVVVESHASGGSWHTVEAALRRGVEVGAVPGPVRSPASVGTNMLLHEGATPVRDADDVLGAIGFGGTAPGAPRPHVPLRAAGLSTRSRGPTRIAGSGQGAPRAATDRGGALGALEQRVLSALAWRPLCLDQVVERSGVPITAVVVALDVLQAQGFASEDSGWWSRGPLRPQ